MAMGTPAVVSAQPQHSAGDIAQARELFNQGMNQRDKGDALGALEKLKAAHALVETPITGLELGRTYVAVGKLVEARETLLSVGRIPVQAAETARSAAARKESAALADQLRPRIPSLTVKITGVPPELVAVTIDGAAVPSAALVAPRLVNPGSHKIVATSTSGGTADTTVDLKEGESRDVELKIVLTAATPPPPPIPPPPPPQVTSPDQHQDTSTVSSRSPTLRIIGYASFGLAAVGVGLGSYFAVSSHQKESDSSALCPGGTCSATSPAQLASLRSQVNSLDGQATTNGQLALTSFIVGGAAIAAGVTLVVLGARGAAEPTTGAQVNGWIGPGCAGLAGRF